MISFPGIGAGAGGVAGDVELVPLLVLLPPVLLDPVPLFDPFVLLAPTFPVENVLVKVQVVVLLASTAMAMMFAPKVAPVTAPFSSLHAADVSDQFAGS